MLGGLPPRCKIQTAVAPIRLQEADTAVVRCEDGAPAGDEATSYATRIEIMWHGYDFNASDAARPYTLNKYSDGDSAYHTVIKQAERRYRSWPKRFLSQPKVKSPATWGTVHTNHHAALGTCETASPTRPALRFREVTLTCADRVRSSENSGGLPTLATLLAWWS